MITGEHFRSLRDGAVFINTARGRIVREDEMIEVLGERNITAFIDVTDPEPPESDSPLYTMPNVFLTPHHSGSGGDEVHRQGDYVVEELRRFLDGRPPWYPVTQDMMKWMA
jgi:phosphoglycerate dehydrogenase-like enzyme